MSEVDDIRRAMLIFDEVCDLPPDEWPGALDRRCAGNVAIRAQVERMLQAETDEHGFLVDSKLGAGVRVISNELNGAQDRSFLPDYIERYRIIRELGRGGMGIVYEAEQESPRRRVALKVIRQAFASRDMVRRFRQEAHVLGQLRHPGIAQIIEAGTTRIGNANLPYFTMELIEGEPFSARAESLSFRERIELVARVCDAVQHAHQKGVVHRDLKPVNILVAPHSATPGSRTGGGSGSFVDAIGQPKIMDFGIARLTDSDVQLTTIQTGAGQIVGTLGYMSPEQIEGASVSLDTRCDVYALGVILYHTLSGRMPHDLTGKSIAEAARIIRDSEPTRLSRVSSARGDIDTIVSKAMEKDPNRRYASAAALAEDLRRYLIGEAIAAHPPSAFYQLRRFAVRNRTLVGGVTMTVIALVIGLFATTWFALGERDARLAAQRAGAESARAAYRASMAAASAALRGDDVASAETQLALAPESLRGWEWRHLHASLDKSIRSALLTATPTLPDDFSRGRAQVWFSAADQTVRRLFVATHLHDGAVHVETRDASTLELLDNWTALGVARMTGIVPSDHVALQRHNTGFSLHDARSGKALEVEAIPWDRPAMRLVTPLTGPASLISVLLRAAEQTPHAGECVLSPDRRWLFTASGVEVKLIPVGRPGLALERDTRCFSGPGENWPSSRRTR